MFIEKIDTTTAKTIQSIPNKFPVLEVSGDDKPLSAKINNTPVIKNKIAERFADIKLFFFLFLFFVHLKHSLSN